MVSKMELMYIRGSPWSLKVVWAINCMSPELQQRITLTDIMRVESMKSRISKAAPHVDHGERDGLLTAPVLFYTQDEKEYVIRNGHEIIEFLSNNEENTEHPFAKFFRSDPTVTKQICKKEEEATFVMEYLRVLFFTEGKGPMTRYMAPKFTDYIPYFHQFLSKQIRSTMKKKYNGLNHDLKEVEAILDKMNFAVKDVDYIYLDQFSYADIAVVTMVEQIIPYFGDKIISLGSLDPDCVKKGLELGWKEKYPNLFTYRKKIMEKHFSEKLHEETFVKLSRALEVDCSKF